MSNVTESLYPLRFQPRFKERVWGGRNLEKLYDKHIPEGKLIGESWEISDRPGDESIIMNGPFKGLTLRWLMQNRQMELLGMQVPSLNGRFPLLIKILDAQDVLSLQVHPPAHLAASLKGEPKTEMWYFSSTEAQARIYAGLKKGVTPEKFAAALNQNNGADVAALFHEIPVSPGDSMFMPSGRVHALGAGSVVFEVQQNSDTTYRVYDWGRPRELHIEESLKSIDFKDYEPGSIPAVRDLVSGVRKLVECDHFMVNEVETTSRVKFEHSSGSFHLFACVNGEMIHRTAVSEDTLKPGDFLLVPSTVISLELIARKHQPSRFLHICGGNIRDFRFDFDAVK